MSAQFITASALDLLTFFEVEPTSRDKIGELLEVVVSARESVTLRLRPDVRIDHQIAEAGRSNS